jgi:hypothetical protein
MGERKPPGREGRQGQTDDGVQTTRPDAAKQDRHVEVDDEGERKLSRLEIGQRLCEVNRSESVDGLELDNQAPRDQQVGPHLAYEPIFVEDGNRGLPNESYAAQRQFEVERLLVDTFEETGAEHTMHLDGGLHHGRRHLIDLCSGLGQPPGVPGVLAVHTLLSATAAETLRGESC